MLPTLCGAWTGAQNTIHNVIVASKSENARKLYNCGKRFLSNQTVQITAMALLALEAVCTLFGCTTPLRALRDLFTRPNRPSPPNRAIPCNPPISAAASAPPAPVEPVTATAGTAPFTPTLHRDGTIQLKADLILMVCSAKANPEYNLIRSGYPLNHGYDYSTASPRFGPFTLEVWSRVLWPNIEVGGKEALKTFLKRYIVIPSGQEKVTLDGDECLIPMFQDTTQKGHLSILYDLHSDGQIFARQTLDLRTLPEWKDYFKAQEKNINARCCETWMTHHFAPDFAPQAAASIVYGTSDKPDADSGFGVGAGAGAGVGAGPGASGGAGSEFVRDLVGAARAVASPPASSPTITTGTTLGLDQCGSVISHMSFREPTSREALLFHYVGSKTKQVALAECTGDLPIRLGKLFRSGMRGYNAIMPQEVTMQSHAVILVGQTRSTPGGAEFTTLSVTPEVVIDSISSRKTPDSGIWVATKAWDSATSSREAAYHVKEGNHLKLVAHSDGNDRNWDFTALNERIVDVVTSEAGNDGAARLYKNTFNHLLMLTEESLNDRGHRACRTRGGDEWPYATRGGNSFFTGHLATAGTTQQTVATRFLEMRNVSPKIKGITMTRLVLQVVSPKCWEEINHQPNTLARLEAKMKEVLDHAVENRHLGEDTPALA